MKRDFPLLLDIIVDLHLGWWESYLREFHSNARPRASDTFLETNEGQAKVNNPARPPLNNDNKDVFTQWMHALE